MAASKHGGSQLCIAAFWLRVPPQNPRGYPHLCSRVIEKQTWWHQRRRCITGRNVESLFWLNMKIVKTSCVFLLVFVVSVIIFTISIGKSAAKLWMLPVLPLQVWTFTETPAQTFCFTKTLIFFIEDSESPNIPKSIAFWVPHCPKFEERDIGAGAEVASGLCQSPDGGSKSCLETPCATEIAQEVAW